MGMHQQWKHFKLKFSFITRTKTFKTLRRLVFEQSHLSSYLPIMKEQLPAKIARIYGDRCYSQEEAIKDSHPVHREAKKGNFISSFFFRSKQSLDPLMTSLLVWYGLVCFFTISAYVMAGMAVVFGEQARLDLSTNHFSILINICCFLIFLGDIFVQLSTGFLTRGMIVLDRERAVRKYVRSLFVVDILLVVMMVVVMASEQNVMNIGVLVLVVIKFSRIFDLDQLFIRNLSTTSSKKAIYVISKLLVGVFLVSHTLGIIFYAIDYAYTLRPICINDQSLCWLYSATAYSPIMAYGWRVRYFYSLYWGVNTVTTISYGDIASNNPYEVVFETICFCCSFLFYGYIINNIVQILLEAWNSKDQFRAELILHTTFMDTIGVSKPDQYDFRDYLQSKFIEQGDRDQELEIEMKSRLPVELREELLKSAFDKLYGGLQEILFNSPSIVKLLQFLTEHRFTQGQTILKQGAPLTHLIYLQKGQLQLNCTRYQKTHPIITICTPDEFVGLYEFFLDERAAFTVETAAASSLYYLNREQVLQQVGRFTDLRENWKLLCDQLKHAGNYERILYCCYFCGSNHHWYRCMDVFPNFNNIILRTDKIPLDRSRIAACRTHVWKDAKSVREMLRKGKVQDAVLKKIEGRVASLRSIKEAWRRDFEVDGHHEWHYYKPAQNFSKIKELWNPKKQSKPPLQDISQLPFAFFPPSLI